MRRPKSLLLAVVLAVSVFMAGCNAKNAMGSEKVATVNGTVITKAEYDSTYNQFEKDLGFDINKLGASEQQKALLQETLKQMTLNKLILQTLITNEATKQGISISDQDVQSFKEQELFSKNPGIKDQFKEYLSQHNMTEAQFDDMVKENLLLERFIEKAAGPQVQVSENEVNAFYNANKGQMSMPEQVKARHILVKAIDQEIKKELRDKNPQLSEDDLEKAVAGEKAKRKAKAEELLKQVKSNPASFAEVAKANSDDLGSGKAGGELGYLMERNTDADFWAAITHNPVGKLIPKVISSQFGYHIIDVQEHKPAHLQSLGEASPKIRKYMEDQKKQAWLQEWANLQKTQATIQIEEAYKPHNPQQDKGAMPGAGPDAGNGLPAPKSQGANGGN